MKESTKAIFKMHGHRIDHALHNYIYFAQYDRYVNLFLKAGRVVGEKLSDSFIGRTAFKTIFNSYHAKVITEGDALKILTLKENVNLGPDTSERIIPFKLANKIILNEPEFIAVMDCPCRASRDNPCQPINVCMAVGRTTAEFWLDHGEKYNVRKIDQQEAIGLIRKERERGHITTAWFKVETGARTGVLCSCCSCCCGGIEGMRIAQGMRGGEELSNIIPSGYRVQYEESKCEQCGKCVETCMFDAIAPDEYGKPVYNQEACMGCGLCVEHCQQEARSLELEKDGLVPLDLDLAREILG